MSDMKISGGGTFERMAQLKRQFEQARAAAGEGALSTPFPSVGAEPSAAATSAPTSAGADAVKGGLGAVEASVQRTNNIHLDVVKGDVDLHEVAAHLKESEITFQFALTVRNKLLDAYREVMRMSV